MARYKLPPRPKERVPEAHKYCILRHSIKLRELVRYKMGQLGLSYAQIEAQTGVSAESLKKVVSGNRPKSISQYDYIRACKHLGIVVDLKIEIV